MGEAHTRELLVLSSRAAKDALALGEADRSPALYARWCEVFRSTVEQGLAGPAGILNATDLGFVNPLAGLFLDTHAMFSQPSLSLTAQGSIENQTIAGAQALAARVFHPALPQPRENRTEAGQRLGRMGDGAVALVLRVLMVPGARASAIPPGLATNDSRLAPFVASVSAYRSSLEDELRQAFGFQARSLLPVDVGLSSDSVVAGSTVVLLLFDASLDRQLLGQREDALRLMAAQESTPALKMEAFGYGLMWLQPCSRGSIRRASTSLRSPMRSGCPC